MKELIIENIELLEEEGKQLNDHQKNFLLKNYNNHFRFTYVEGHLCYLFSMSEKEYAKMEHYLGFEYERESREMYVNCEGKVVVSYHYCDRIDDLMSKLQKLENADS